MKAIRNIFFIFLQVTTLAAFSQKQDIRFEHLGTDRGLSQSNVLCILQDSRGFMWFGTRDGLNKYDGYKFTVYKNDVHNPNSLSNNFVRAVVESRNGDLWVATSGGGLCRYDRERDSFTEFKNDPKSPFGISNDFATSILEDSEGNLWVGTEGGLNKLDRATNHFIRFTFNPNNPNSISDSYVRTVFEDSRHDLWIGTFNGGLNLFNKKSKTFTRFQHDEKDSKSIGSNNVYTLFEDSKHRLWIGTNGGGLDLFDRDSGTFTHFTHDVNNENSLSGNTVYALNEDSEKNLWIGTENGGVNILNAETGIIRIYENNEVDNASLSNNSVYAIYRDNKSNIWLGTFNGGVDLVNPDASKFTHFKHILFKNSLSNNHVLCIYEDSQRNIWIGTDGGGLDSFDPATGNFTHFRHEKNNKNSICGDYVLSVYEDSRKNLWVGTWGDGLTVMNRATHTFQHFKNNPADASSLSSNNAWKIFEDRNKNLWVGTYGGGLNLFNPANNTFTHYQHDANNKTGPSSNNIYSIFEDSEGKLWVSTDGGGLNLFNNKTGTISCFVHDDRKNSIINNSTGSICEDRNKNLWIGTMAGLSFLDKKTGRFTNYTTEDGLPNNVIFGILEDQRGNLWISTSKGISRFDPVNKVFKNFDVSDGLQSNEFKIQAFCKSHDGMMYFGGNNGFNQFFPDNIRDHSFEPPLVITNFQIFNKEVPISGDEAGSSPLKKNITETKEITVSYKSSVISFEFASLNYTIAEKKQYAYKLEGFDAKWNFIGTKHTATYTNLDAGEYTFKVKSLDNEGNWSGRFAEIKLTITPPFWKTWWFRVLALVSIIGIIILLHHLRMKTVNAQKKKLERQVASLLDKAVAQGKYEIASDVMHDIGNAVVGFGSYLTRIRRLLEQDSPENLQNLAGFFETQQPALAAAIGETKAGAVIKMLRGISETHKTNQDEMRKSMTEQLNIIAHIQEILNIQRQYITGHETQERKPVNLRNIINDSLSMLFATIDKMAIAVSLNVPPELPIIKGDRTRLMQALLNVLKNSIEAIDPNAKEKTIALNAYRLDGHLVVQVKDSGNGFDKSTAERLFSRGFSTKFSGSGLGLYNCRVIVESHKGTINITSDGPGKGALATIGFKI